MKTYGAKLGLVNPLLCMMRFTNSAKRRIFQTAQGYPRT